MELSFPEGDVLAWCHWCGLRDTVIEITVIPPTSETESDQ